MAIRFVDRRANLGRIQPQLDGASSLLQGTHVGPPGRTGVITSQVEGVLSSIIGGVTTSSNRSGSIASTLGGALATVTGTHLAPPPATILFRANFANPNANGNMQYNMGPRYPNNVGGNGDGQVNWTVTHLPSGGHNGAPAVMLTSLANRYQYNMGWQMPPLSWAPALGDSMFIRLRFKVADTSRFVDGMTNKFIDWNAQSTSRVIVWIGNCYEYESGGGTLDWLSTENNARDKATPSYFGQPGTKFHLSPNTNNFGYVTVSRGTGWKSCDPVLISYGNRTPAPAPSPLGGSAAPVNGWNQLQLQCKSGNDAGLAAPNSDFKIWANNNTEATPSSRQSAWNTAAEPGGLQVGGWTAPWTIGGYAGDNPGPSQDFSWIISALEIGTTYDPTWYLG